MKRVAKQSGFLVITVVVVSGLVGCLQPVNGDKAEQRHRSQ